MQNEPFSCVLRQFQAYLAGETPIAYASRGKGGARSKPGKRYENPRSKYEPHDGGGQCAKCTKGEPDGRF